MDDEHLLLAFVQWLTSFPAVTKPVKDVEDLCDGIALFELCHNIDAKRFKLLQTTDIGNNWVFRVNNLKKLYRMITCYYEDVLNQPVQRLDPIGVNAIAKDSDVGELLGLCKLVLFLAVQCEDNVHYVSPIQNMDPDGQRAIMILVETVQKQLTEERPAVGDIDGMDSTRIDEERLLALETELKRLLTEKQTLENQYQSLRDENTDTVLRYDEITAENKELVQKLRDAERSLTRVDQSGKADFLLRTEIDQLKQELEKLEARCHAAEQVATEQNTTITELNRRLKESSRATEEVTRLRDQVQEYKHAADKLQKTEHIIEKYKKKLEESGDLRRQLKSLEEQNRQLGERNQSIEEEYRKVSQFKPLMDSYKDQVATLESKYNMMVVKNSEYEHELRESRDRLAQLELERQKDQEQLSSLEDNLRELELTGASMVETTPLSPGPTAKSLNDALGEPSMFELKAKVARLENQLHQARKDQYGDEGVAHPKILLLENLLEDIKRSKAKYEREYLESHQRNLRLEAELQQLRNQVTNGDGVAGTSLAESDVVMQLRTRLNESDDELSRLRTKLAEQEVNLQRATQELTVAKSDLSMVSKDKLEALDALKLQTGADLECLRKETKLLETCYNELEAGNKEKDQQINQLLREKDQLQQDYIHHKDLLLEKERANSELRESLLGLQGKNQDEVVVSLQAQVDRVTGDNTRLQMDVLKYEVHTKKLKSLLAQQEDSMRDLRSQAPTNNFPEALESMKKTLLAKTQELDKVKQDHHRFVRQWEREREAVISGWVNMGTRFMHGQFQKSNGPRSPHQPVSWMSQQRRGLNISLQRPQ